MSWSTPRYAHSARALARSLSLSVCVRMIQYVRMRTVWRRVLRYARTSHRLDRVHIELVRLVARLENGDFATLKYLFLTNEVDQERREPSEKYRKARAALHGLPPEEDGEPCEPNPKRRRVDTPLRSTLREGKLVLPEVPVIVALVEVHEYVDKKRDPFRIKYPGGKECWIDVRAIISQAALALYSQEEQEATACPPHDLYVDSCARRLEILLLTRLFLWLLLLGVSLSLLWNDCRQEYPCD